MSRFYNNKGAGPAGAGAPSKSILGVLKAAEIIETKPVLPAEILATILDYLPVPDLLRFARVSRRMREMVYDDTRWIARLQSMGCWNEAEARRRFEEAMAKRRRDAATAAAAANAAVASTGTPGGAVVGSGGGGAGSVPGAHGVTAVGGGARKHSGSMTLFDASLEEERRRQRQQQQEQQQKQQQQQQQQQLEGKAQLVQVRDGFETLAIAGGAPTTQQQQPLSQPPSAAAKSPLRDTEALLSVLKTVQSVRGYARQEYGKVYGALAPFYWDLQRAKTHADPVVFKVFRDPERQAQMLTNLRTFAQSDWAQGWRERDEKLAVMMNIFESAVLREFEQGYEFWDVDGRMRKYAHVLDVLNHSSAGVDLFVQKHPIFADRELAANNAMDCIRQTSSTSLPLPLPLSSSSSVWGNPSAVVAPVSTSFATDNVITLEPSRQFFERLAWKVNEQSAVIGRIFPRPASVFWRFVDKVREDIVMEYITPLLDETHERSLAAYLTAVSGLFEQCLQFLRSLEPPKGPEAAAKEAANKDKASSELNEKDKRKSGSVKVQHGRTRSYLGGGTAGALAGGQNEGENDEDDDEDGWTPKGRVRRVKEMAFRTFEPHLDLYLQEELDFFTKHAETEVADWDRKLSEQDASVESFYMANFNRQEVKKDFLSSFKKVVMMPVTVLPNLPGQLLGGSSKSTTTTTMTTANGSNLSLPPAQQPASGRASPSPFGGEKLPDKAPDDELAAKAALMASRLEGIKSLFSIEIALNLVHTAKSSLGRAAVFIQLGGQAAAEAREQCETIFVVLLRVLGNGHVKQGFDRAVEHLSQYNPRAVENHRNAILVDSAGAVGEKDSSNGNGGGGVDANKAPGDGGVAPLMTFIELVNVGDLISQMIDVFYEQQLAGPKIADRNDFLDPAGLAKKRFEQMIDESVAAGLNKGIDVLMEEVEYICATMQKPTDYYPEAADAVAESGLFSLNGTLAGGGSGGSRASIMFGGGGAGAEKGGGAATSSPGAPSPGEGGSGGGSGGGGSSTPATSVLWGVGDIGPTPTARRVVELVRGHTNMLKGSTEKTMLDVFNGEVGLRLFTAVCKHLKRQRISMAGAVHVIADMTLYFDYVRTLRNPDLLAYFRALRELSQLYLIDARHHAKEMAVIIADGDRFGGVFRAEEVYEFAERRADWYQVKRDVERAMYGLECRVM
ncbi:secretion pathway protein sls2 [Niveomyces insectorum RCEF 264]|uniref:Secretion pathway protein sls2 n=1 Tax=Niveomyces insectorum RCEF 264 TaxID=1081102 RepID=A0A162MNH9_9HYPO|nr:secretion pathway protein sls2 [Niveomyces insectorum RCEF 264]